MSRLSTSSGHQPSFLKLTRLVPLSKRLLAVPVADVSRACASRYLSLVARTSVLRVQETSPRFEVQPVVVKTTWKEEQSVPVSGNMRLV
jgi:hypothetical protein